jgi:hypothetical protein
MPRHAHASDPPWNTGMATADAIDAFPDMPRPEIDQLVRVALLELLDAGFIFFFRAARFEDEFAPRDEADALDRAEVRKVLSQRHHDHSHFPAQHEIGLSFRATRAGTEYFATLTEQASTLFSADGSDDLRVAGRREPTDSAQ